MLSKKMIVGALGAVVFVVGWYASRLERLFVNQKVNESLPAVTILALPRGKQVLRPTDFRTSNGPDVHLSLVAAGDATDNASVTNARFLQLGARGHAEAERRWCASS